VHSPPQARSKPMERILDRLMAYGEFDIVYFGDEVILNEPIENWPLCDVLISWHSDGFPLKKAQEYMRMRKAATIWLSFFPSAAGPIALPCPAASLRMLGRPRAHFFSPSSLSGMAWEGVEEPRLAEVGEVPLFQRRGAQCR
jgi:hypothetical protein